MSAFVSCQQGTAGEAAAVRSSGVSIVAQASLPKVQNASPPDPKMSQGESSEGAYKVVMPAADSGTWTKANERQFAILTARKATEQLDAESLAEWRSLQSKRRRKLNPPSAAAIIFEHRRRQLEAKLVESLQAYVHFIEAPRHTKA